MPIDHPPSRDYRYYREAFRGRPMPFAFVDLELLDANASRIAARATAKAVRVASKSLRSVALLKRILASGPSFRGVLCYSGWEAVFLSRQGLDDLLVGYPLWHDDAIQAVCEAAREGKRLTLMVDSPEHVEHLGALARASGVQLPVCIDADMSSIYPGLRFGVLRSPVATATEAVDLAESIRRQPSLRLEGLMGYEAQIAGVPDAAPDAALRNAVVRLLKARSVREVARRRAAIVRALQDNGHRLRFVNGGGTGSLETTAREDWVTEVTAGSGFYAPGLFDGYRGFRHLPAAGFALEIVRRPAPHVFTCHGGGYVASGSAGRDKLPRPYLPRGAALVGNEGAGEVQTPVVHSGDEPLSLGDPIFMRHAKAGELCEHFRTLLLVAGGRVVDEVATYRGDGQCFL